MSDALVNKLIEYQVYTHTTVENTDNSGTTVPRQALECSTCAHKYLYTMDNKRKPSSTVLIHHMKTKHETRWLQLCDLYSVFASVVPPSTSSSTDTSTSSDISPSSSPLIRRSSSKRSSSSLDTASTQVQVYSESMTDEQYTAHMHNLMIGFSVFNISLRSISNPLFRKFIHSTHHILYERDLTRQVLSKQILEYKDQLRTMLLSHLNQPHWYITLAVDGWTNACGDKVWVIMLLCNNIAYYWCSFSNWKSVSTMDTNYIVTQLKPVVDDLLQHKLKI